MLNNVTIFHFHIQITLKQLHLSTDYGLILTWGINLKNDEFTCDAVFVYKEANRHEILLDNSPVIIFYLLNIYYENLFVFCFVQVNNNFYFIKIIANL